jgi:hypothetical protein
VPLEAILLVVAGLWIAVMVVVTFLCKAAKLGDEALESANRRAAAGYRATASRSPSVIVRTRSPRTRSARSLSI